jgi:small subunit ribosomal protein S18
MNERKLQKSNLSLDNFDNITYKDTKILIEYVNEQGKILPRRTTGLSSKQQKRITRLIKRARIAALLPFILNKV